MLPGGVVTGPFGAVENMRLLSRLPKGQASRNDKMFIFLPLQALPHGVDLKDRAAISNVTVELFRQSPFGQYAGSQSIKNGVFFGFSPIS